MQRFWRWWRDVARYDTWNVGVVTLPMPIDDVAKLAVAIRQVAWMPPQPALYYIADPFPYRHAGRDWLLVEEYGHPWCVRGRISRIDPSNAMARPVPVIDRASHLSYPYVITSEDGRVWCVPEMAEERNGCALFELGADGSWIERTRILHGRIVVDPTIVRFEHRWWLFNATGEGRGSLELEVHYAEVIEGPWMPHALNPVKRDAASARPGGRPFVMNGRLFRPAQDCSRTYGGALTIMVVDELTPKAFRERPAVRLEPDPGGPYPDGLHHLVIDGDRIYIDGKRQRHDHWLWLKRWRGIIFPR